jgi:tetratricopeptide (TPR) repeat protein
MPVQDDKPNARAAAPPINLPPPGPEQVSVDSRWSFSAYENPPAVKWLLDQSRTASGDGSNSVDALVQRWPDVTLELLRESLATNGDLPVRLSLADAYDRAFGPIDSNAGWSAALAVSASGRESFSAFGQRCNQLLTLFHSGDFADAARIDPVSIVPADAPPAIRAEALRLAGLTALLNDHPDRAADLFDRALGFAQRGPRHVKFEIGLLLCESQRRSNHPTLAAGAWTIAVSAATGIRDPQLWDRAILSKPGNAEWPMDTSIARTGEPDFAPGLLPDTGDVLIGIGKMHLSRAAPEPALLAFSRAEPETANAGKKLLARLLRAQSMIAMQQGASAIPMLDALAKSDDPRIAWRAQAIEGDALCRVLDDRQRGIPIMLNALKNSETIDWPGKGRLGANLGLYCLLEGDEDDGLRELHQAQASFTAEEKWDDLAGSLKNEAAYLRQTGKTEEADVIQKRADEVSRKAGLPPGPLAATESGTP